MKRHAAIGTILALALAGGSLAVHAQTPSPAPAAKSQAQKAEARARWMANFKKTDKNGDGGLSKEELAATKGFSIIRENFDAMDANKDGKVTVDERQEWGKKNRKPIR
jgi:Ca2+-binding EF-hand superfamily protein